MKQGAESPELDGRIGEFSMDARAALKLDPCVRCKDRGHYCKAVCDGEKEGERLCVFCEDGVPCPYETMQRRSLTAQPGHFAPKKPASTSHASTSKPTPQKSAPARELSRPGRVGIESAGASLQSGTGTAKRNAVTAGKDRQKEKSMEFPLCKCNCGERTRSNRSPYIKGHNPDTKRSAAPRKTTRAARKTRVSPRKPAARPASGVATICVTEAHLDSFWQKLTLEEKAAIFTRQLEAAS